MHNYFLKIGSKKANIRDRSVTFFVHVTCNGFPFSYIWYNSSPAFTQLENDTLRSHSITKDFLKLKGRRQFNILCLKKTPEFPFSLKYLKLVGIQLNANKRMNEMVRLKEISCYWKVKEENVKWQLTRKIKRVLF